MRILYINIPVIVIDSNNTNVKFVYFYEIFIEKKLQV